MIKKHFLLFTFLCSISLFAQDYFPKNDGVSAKNTNYMAFTNAKIYITPTQVINKGTLLIKNGKVMETGASVNIPKNALVVDVSGKSIYPSFIDIHSSFWVLKNLSAHLVEVDLHNMMLVEPDIIGMTILCQKIKLLTNLNTTLNRLPN